MRVCLDQISLVPGGFFLSASILAAKSGKCVLSPGLEQIIVEEKRSLFIHLRGPHQVAPCLPSVQSFGEHCYEVAEEDELPKPKSYPVEVCVMCLAMLSFIVQAVGPQRFH